MSDNGHPPIRTAVVGYGYWGPNIVRNLVERPEFRLEALCELDETRAAASRRRHPGARIESDFDAILGDPGIEAVMIATPPRTHYTLAKAALEAGKHVWSRSRWRRRKTKPGSSSSWPRTAQLTSHARSHVPLQPAGQQGARPDP